MSISFEWQPNGGFTTTLPTWVEIVGSMVYVVKGVPLSLKNEDPYDYEVYKYKYDNPANIDFSVESLPTNWEWG